MDQIASPERAVTKRRTWYWVWRFAILAVICALLAVIVVRAFFVDVFHINSTSMQNTLNPGQSIAVDRRAYTDGQPERGDVIVFDGRGSFLPYAPASVIDDVLGALRLSGTGNSYVKRVIGIGGDHVSCAGKGAPVLVNGKPVAEPYLYAGNAPSEQRFDVIVPEDRIWVMGDHREKSADSRSLLGASGGGMISVDRVTGKATSVIWPLDERHKIH